MSKIASVFGREILDSRGNPTVEVTVTLEDGSKAIAGVPSGASTGAYEAVELRDGDEKRFKGLGVTKAVQSINTEIAEAVIGMEAGDQNALDTALIELDGTKNKARLGANALLGVSLAAARAAAVSENIPLYKHIEKLYGPSQSTAPFPVPMFNILNGGKHSDSGLSAQEFKIVPKGIDTYPEQLRAGSEIFHSLQKILAQGNFSVGVGDEGGFAPHLEGHKQALETINQAIREAGYKEKEEVFIGLDVAANSFYDAEEDHYVLKPENVSLSKESLINVYREWIQQYGVVSIEDGLNENDWAGWTSMCEKLCKEAGAWKDPLMLIGDDLIVTNVDRLKQAIEANACNAVLIKPNQIGTLSETLACMQLAEKEGKRRVVSHRSGETTDDFIADLAVGTKAEFIKTGSLSRGERIVKYNRLLQIWNETR